MEPNLKKFLQCTAIVSVVVLSLIGAMLALTALFGKTFIAALFNGVEVPLISHLFEAHRAQAPNFRGQSFYDLKLLELVLRWAAGLMRGVLITILFSSVIIFRNRLWRGFLAYFQEADSAYNLAVFRIFLFGYIAWNVNPSSLSLLASQPIQTLVPPFGFQFLSEWVPIKGSFALIASISLRVVCVFAAIGFFTRPSMLVSLVLGWYVFLIGNAYGKVNHGWHHLYWFTWVLAFSPCADVLSVDYWIARFRKRSLAVPSQTYDRAYGLPLRICWALLGVAYLFPGLKKFWVGGADWFLSDNLKYYMWNKWAEFGTWTPAFRIDYYPWLYKSAAFISVIWEAGFLFLLFIPSLRLLAPIIGICFHLSVLLFLNISFSSLWYSYVAFIDWEKIYQKIILPIFGGPRPQPIPVISGSGSRKPQAVRRVAWVGGFFLIMNLVFGYLGIGQSWPFAGYPTFSTLAVPFHSSLEIVAYPPFGVGRRYQTSELPFAKEALEEMTREALANRGTDKMEKRLFGIGIGLFAKGFFEGELSRLEFYEVLSSTNPDLRGPRVLRRDFLYQIEASALVSSLKS